MSRSERLVGLYESLIQTEKRLDEEITKKKMVVEEAHFKKIKEMCVMRINIMVERTTENSVFVLIGGKVKTADAKEDDRVVQTRPIGSVIRKLLVDMTEKNAESRIAERSTIESANPLQSDSTLVKQVHSEEKRSSISEEDMCPRDAKSTHVWNKTTSEDADFFEWDNTDRQSRIAEYEIKCKCRVETGTVYISPISYTGTYTVCKDLADAIGTKAGTKPVILLAIWRYIVAQKMRDSKNTKLIVCNEVFRRMYKKETTTFKDIIETLEEYLCPLEMISVSFDIPSAVRSKTQAAYDITMEIEPMQKEYAYANKNRVEMQDKKIKDILERVEKQNKKIQALEQFIEDPRKFITKWILESSKELQIISDDLCEVGDGFFMQKEIQESVYQLLQDYK